MLGLFHNPETGPQTQLERLMGGLMLGTFGIMLGVLAWCIGSVMTGNNGWLGLYVAVSVIVLAPIGYWAPRWVKEVLGTLLWLLTF